MQEYNKFLISLGGAFASILSMVGVGIDVTNINGILTILVPAVTTLLVFVVPNIGDSFDRGAAYVDDIKKVVDQLQTALSQVPSPNQPE